MPPLEKNKFISMSFSIFDPSQSSVPEFLVEREQKEARDYLYSDIPPALREAFDQNNKKWIAQAPRTDEWSSKLEDCLIIGINADYAVAFKSFASPDLIFRRKHQMHQVEITQFANAWTSMLQRCQNVIQYETVNKKFMSLVKYDPSLKPAAEIILKSPFLLGFKNNLPKEMEEGKRSLQEGAAERNMGSFVYVPVAGVGEEIKPSPGKSNKVKVDLFVYGKNKWRQSKIDIYCMKDTVPEGRLTKKHLIIAYYVDVDVVCVQKLNLSKKDSIDKTRYFRTKTKKQSPLLIGSYDLISDGLFVYHQNYLLSIENAFINSISVDTNSLLCIGTNWGTIYKVSPDGTKLEGFEMTKDILYALDVKSNLCQSIYAATYFDKKEDVTFNIERPLSTIKKGTFIISIDKYGVVRLNFVLVRGSEIQFNPPSDLRILVEDVQPWYRDGIYMNDTGDTIRVLYPDGRIRSLKLKE